MNSDVTEEYAVPAPLVASVIYYHGYRSDDKSWNRKGHGIGKVVVVTTTTGTYAMRSYKIENIILIGLIGND